MSKTKVDHQTIPKQYSANININYLRYNLILESNFKKLYAKTLWFPESFADPELTKLRTETSFKSCQISVPVCT